MLAYVNGRLVEENEPAIAVNDRSFRYGDGLFETIRVRGGKAFLWEKHMARLKRGAEFFGIVTPKGIAGAVRDLIKRNRLPDCTVRIHLSRGAGKRGYSVKDCVEPLVVITTHEASAAPSELRLMSSSVRVLAGDPTAQFKTANRLANVRAKYEADEAGADDALILNDYENIVEASAANVFCVFGKDLVTPPLCEGVLAGTTREFLLEQAAKCGLNAAESVLAPDELYRADGVFLSSAFLLATPAVSLDGIPLSNVARETIEKLRRICEEA